MGKPTRTHIAFVLDCSGSMITIKPEIVRGFNKQLETIQEKFDPELTDVSLYTFNGEVTENFFGMPVSELKPLTDRSYHPNGTTALYDAVAQSISRLSTKESSVCPACEHDHANSDKFLVIVVSDGAENSSKEYGDNTPYPLFDKYYGYYNTGLMTGSNFITYWRPSHTHAGSVKLAELVRSKKSTGRWEFVYIGSNQDLSVANTIFGNNSVYSWISDSSGTNTMNSAVSSGLIRYAKSGSYNDR